MKDKKKLLAMMLVLVTFFFTACEDDDSNSGFDPEQAKTIITSLPTMMGTQMGDIMRSEGLQTFDILIDAPYPFGTSNKKSIFNKINKLISPNSYVNKELLQTKDADPGFDFNARKGTYTYVHTPQPHWDVQLGGQKIIILFPSDSTNMSTNNATFTIHGYTETQITVATAGGTITLYQPTAIDADLVVDGTTLLDVDITSSWIASGENAGTLTSLNANLSLTPYQITAAVQLSPNNSISININITQNDNTIILVEGSMIPSTDTTIMFNGIEGRLTIGDLSFRANINASMINQAIDSLSNNPEKLVEYVNTQLSVGLYQNDVKVADIKIMPLESVPTGAIYPFDIVFMLSDESTITALPTILMLYQTMNEFLALSDLLDLEEDNDGFHP